MNRPTALVKRADLIPAIFTSNVLAAGAVVWRSNKGELEVLLVHQSSDEAWAIPKGKLDPGERFAKAAVREVKEETGYLIRLGRPMPSRTYRVGAGEKTVRYWAAKVEQRLAKGPKNLKEIDRTKWFKIKKAIAKAAHAGDRELLTLLERWYLDGELDTHSVALLYPPGQAELKPAVQALTAYASRELYAGSSKKAANSLEKYARNFGMDLVQFAVKDGAKNSSAADLGGGDSLLDAFKAALEKPQNSVFCAKEEELKPLFKQARKASAQNVKQWLAKDRLSKAGVTSVVLHANSSGKIVSAERFGK